MGENDQVRPNPGESTGIVDGKEITFYAKHWSGGGNGMVLCTANGREDFTMHIDDIHPVHVDMKELRAWLAVIRP